MDHALLRLLLGLLIGLCVVDIIRQTNRLLSTRQGWALALISIILEVATIITAGYLITTIQLPLT